MNIKMTTNPHSTLKVCVLFMVTAFMLSSCDSKRQSSPVLKKDSDAVRKLPYIEELPYDITVAGELGLWMQNVAINFPSSMKLSTIVRVYEDGALSSKHSSRQVTATKMPVGKAYRSLGLFDPEMINPEPQDKLKVFGFAVGPLWVQKVHGPYVQSVINIVGNHELEVGKEQVILELYYGVTPSQFEDPRKNAKIRVTMGVLLEALTEKELNDPTTFSSGAYAVTE